VTGGALSREPRAGWEGERVLALLFLVLCVAYGAGTFSFMQTTDSDVVGPATFPRVIAVLGGVCALVFLTRSSRMAAGAEGVSERHSVSDLLPLGLTLAYCLAFEPLGYAISTFLYLVFGIRTLGRGWGQAIAVSLVSTVVFYLVFSVAIESHLPDGPLPLRSLLGLG